MKSKRVALSTAELNRAVADAKASLQSGIDEALEELRSKRSAREGMAATVARRSRKAAGARA